MESRDILGNWSLQQYKIEVCLRKQGTTSNKVGFKSKPLQAITALN